MRLLVGLAAATMLRLLSERMVVSRRAAFDSQPFRTVGGTAAARVRAALEPQRPEMVALLGDLVSIESPSDDPAGLEAMAGRLGQLFREVGEIERLTGDHGSNLRLTISGSDARPPALVLCHYDTVWPRGTLQQIPFSVDAEGLARGPACFDMKGGIVLLWFAIRALRTLQIDLGRSVEVLFTCDEEVGSPSSRPLIESAALQAGVAYVLESPLPGGTLKTARKGTGDYRLRIAGRAAHAGVEPQKGVNAIHELAFQVQALHALNDYAAGTSVNVGVVRGGTRPNVVPALAEAEIDVRVTSLAEAARLDTALRSLRPVLSEARLSVEGGLNRPPMERTAEIGRLFERARSIASALGVPDLCEGSTGGGSDGNFTAALGVPTLDGLGPEGEGAHAAHEHVVVDSLPRRAALLAGLFAEV